VLVVTKHLEVGGHVRTLSLLTSTNPQARGQTN
jgi:hypothetical protein